MTRPVPERLASILLFVHEHSEDAATDLRAELEALTAERDKAQAACAAMREALGWFVQATVIDRRGGADIYVSPAPGCYEEAARRYRRALAQGGAQAGG